MRMMMVDREGKDMAGVPPSIRCLHSLSLGLIALNANLINRTRRHLLDMLKTANSTMLNSQLKCVALSLLGSLYLRTADVGQAEKILASAYIIAKRAENDLLSFISGHLLVCKREYLRI